MALEGRKADTARWWRNAAGSPCVGELSVTVGGATVGGATVGDEALAGRALSRSVRAAAVTPGECKEAGDGREK